MNNYINPQNPVYFSYAGGDEKTEIIVKQLRELFEQENIDYRDYQSERTPFDYRKPLTESEKEIGNGYYIVVIFSNKYVDLNYNGQTSLHCMNEWHNITKLTNFEEHIFRFLLMTNSKKDLVWNNDLKVYLQVMMPSIKKYQTKRLRIMPT